MKEAGKKTVFRKISPGLARKVCTGMLAALVLFFIPGFIPGTSPVHAEAAARISRKSITLLAGDSFKLNVKGAAGKVKWSSGNRYIAKVNTKGKVTACQPGKTVITAKAGKKIYKAKVTVVSAKLNRKKATLETGDTYRLLVTGSVKVKKWETSDKEVAAVSKKGLVIAKKAGKAKISAVIGDSRMTAAVTVKEAAKTAEKTESSSGNRESESLRNEGNGNSGLTEETELSDAEEGKTNPVLHDTENEPQPPESSEQAEEQESTYSYELKILNNPKYHLYTYTLHDGRPQICNVILYLKTDNPDPGTITLENGGGDHAWTVNGYSLYYADVFWGRPREKMYDVYEHSLLGIRGGWLRTQCYEIPGTKTVTAYETLDGKKRKVAEITFTVQDGDEPFKEWRSSVIREVVSRNMSDLEKAYALRDYIRSHFIYWRSSSLDHVGDTMFTFDAGAMWEARVISCTGSSELIQWFMKDLGIDSRLAYTTNINGVENGHVFNKVLCNGEWHSIDAQPHISTGIVNFDWDYVN